jgi:hypothetical protein
MLKKLDAVRNSMTVHARSKVSCSHCSDIAVIINDNIMAVVAI